MPGADAPFAPPSARHCSGGMDAPDPESGRRLWRMVFGYQTDKGGRDVGIRGRLRIGFVEEQCFQFGAKKLWRDGKR